MGFFTGGGAGVSGVPSGTSGTFGTGGTLTADVTVNDFTL